MKVVRSSPLRTGRLYPQEFPGTHFRPQGTWFRWLLRKKYPVTPLGDFFLFSVLHLYCYFVLDLPFVLTVQHTTQTSMPPTGFEPAIPAGERLQTHALDRSATGIGRDRSRDPPTSSVVP